jgi:ABC-type antimicrobial peptide transport system permease subunit
MLVVAAGLGLGLLAVIAATRYLETVLVGIHATDPRILGGTLLLLAAVALPANLLPAYRATREDPRTALQGQ